MSTTNTSEDGLNICKDNAYQNSLILKQRFQLKNIPPQRYDNLVNNPYITHTQYTQNDFDIRRKAEILKYTATKTNTKTNNLTRSERWAQLVNRSTQRPSQSFIQSNIISQTPTSITIQTCPSGTIIQTPTYASGIPGPIRQLYLDPNVPLYNYISTRDNYSILNSLQSSEEFIYDSGIDQLDKKLSVSSTISISLTSIYILNPINQFRDFNIQFPISIFIQGSVLSSQTSNIIPYKSPITVSMYDNPFTCTVQYGYNPVQNITYDIIFSGPKSVIYDISMVPKYNDPMNNSFYGNQYIGLCSIKNFRLLDSTGKTVQNGLTTQSGIIYDILLKTFDSAGNSLYSINGIDDTNSDSKKNYSTYFNKPTYGIIANIMQSSVNKTINCSIQNSTTYPSISSITPLTVF